MSRMVACRVGVGAAVMSVLVSCSGGSSGPGGGVSGSGSPVSSSPSSEVSSSRPSKSVTPSGPQPSETFTPEQLEAANTVIEYFRISDEVYSSLDGDSQPLKDITMGQTQELDMEELNDYRQNGQVQIGTTIVRITKASVVKEENGLAVVMVQACTDTSKADIVDPKTGKSIFEPGKRSIRLKWNIDVAKTGDGWKIRDSTNENALGCPA